LSNKVGSDYSVAPDLFVHEKEHAHDYLLNREYQRS
jgi:hypothetical protein